MNFYQRHIGDWVTATAHLTEVEECIYSRLLDQYYARESALPLEIEKVCRLVRALSKDSKKAVTTVLEEFFDKTDDGWHQKRCDAEIAKFKEEEPLRIQKEENIKERKRRFNERRKHMFEALRAVDIVPAWDVKMPELEKLFEQHVTRPNSGTGTPPRTSEERPTDKNGTTTHTQEPITNNHINNINKTHTTPLQQSEFDFGKTTEAGEICKAIKAGGIPGVSPSHPELLALIAKGVTLEQFVDATKTAVKKNKGFPYMLGVVKGLLSDANAIGNSPGMPDAKWDENGETIRAKAAQVGFEAWEGDSPSQTKQPELFSTYTKRLAAFIEAQKGKQ